MISIKNVLGFIFPKEKGKTRKLLLEKVERSQDVLISSLEKLRTEADKERKFNQEMVDVLRHMIECRER